MQNPNWTVDRGQELYYAEPSIIRAGLPTVHVFPNRPRNVTLFFAGTVGMAMPFYSHGVRQASFAMFHNRSELRGLRAPSSLHWARYVSPALSPVNTMYISVSVDVCRVTRKKKREHREQKQREWI